MSLGSFPKDLPALSARLDLDSGFCSETGARSFNEDFVAFSAPVKLAARKGAVAAVADGVGGSLGGRVAAEVAVRCAAEGYFGGDDLRGVRKAGVRAVAAANAWIHGMGRSDPGLTGMACTLSLVVLRGRMAHLFHVGDSRIYRLRDGVLEVLTTDHATGLPSYRNVLTRALGAEPHVGIEYRAVPLSLHDRLMLCTDGVHGALPAAAIRDILTSRGSPAVAAQDLVAAAHGRDRGDNATALVVDVLGLPPPDAADLAADFTDKPVLPLPRPGQTVDGFALETVLGDGRYTRVFRARDTVEDRTVVLKFPKALGDSETMLRQAFMRETWIAGRVRSPWVGESYAIAADRRSGIYVAMPFYDGGTLEHRLRTSGPLSLAAGLDLAQKLARGVAALHRAGIVHRDIKPDNVIVEAARPGRGPGLRLVDLGVARLPDMEDVPSAHAPGTPSFMAPELFDGHAGDAASDQFALGVTVYRLFTEAYPYGEIEPFTRPRFRRPVPLAVHRPDLPAWLDRVILRAVAVDPRERYDDVLEFAFACEHGADRALPVPPSKQPLLERDPVAVWRAVAAALFVALLFALLALAHRPAGPTGRPRAGSETRSQIAVPVVLSAVSASDPSMQPASSRPETGPVAPTSLGDELRVLIAQEGPIGVDRFMALALGHPTRGYYMTRDPFGAVGDFTTAPEISQMFGELLGLWAADVWHGLGRPDPVRLIELGPGRGTLMADALRAARVLPPFLAAIDLHFVETSPVLRAIQRETVGNSRAATWHENLHSVPSGPAIVLANEFFDALPIRQFVCTSRGWCERLVGLDASGALGFGLAPAPESGVAGERAEGSVIEINPTGQGIVRDLAKRFVAEGGALLAIDYGAARSGFGDTLQAVKAHRFHDVLAEPGEADLTAHVDFAALARVARSAGLAVHGPVSQGSFLGDLGIAHRADALGRAATPEQRAAIEAACLRLTGPNPGMGDLFKVLAVTSPGMAIPPGFASEFLS